MVSELMTVYGCFVINHLQDQKYPGEYFTPTMKMTDEMNQTASGFLQLVVNNSDQVFRCIAMVRSYIGLIILFV